MHPCPGRGGASAGRGVTREPGSSSSSHTLAPWESNLGGSEECGAAHRGFASGCAARPADPMGLSPTGRVAASCGPSPSAVSQSRCLAPGFPFTCNHPNAQTNSPGFRTAPVSQLGLVLGIRAHRGPGRARHRDSWASAPPLPPSFQARWSGTPGTAVVLLLGLQILDIGEYKKKKERNEKFFLGALQDSQSPFSK